VSGLSRSGHNDFETADVGVFDGQRIENTTGDDTASSQRDRQTIEVTIENANVSGLKIVVPRSQ